MDKQQKEELLQKFYMLVPHLEHVENFGWEPAGDNAYRIFCMPGAAKDNLNEWFTEVYVNIETKVHSKYSYFDGTGVRKVEATL